jgi:hypothetical protein
MTLAPHEDSLVRSTQDMTTGLAKVALTLPCSRVLNGGMSKPGPALNGCDVSPDTVAYTSTARQR